MHIVHLSSVHHVSDTRVFHKECRSLAEAGFKVTLIANADRDEVVGGVDVRALPARRGGRISRMTRTVWHVFRQARRVDGDAYHLHDPELLPIGILLKMMGKHVVFDAHEHVAKQILTKPWLPSPFRRAASTGYRLLESVAVRLIDAVVVADPSQCGLYPASKVCVIENFPIISEDAAVSSAPYASRPARVAYVGGISVLRGVREMVEAVRLVNECRPLTLALGGRFIPPALQGEIKASDGWQFVDYRGFLDRVQVYEMMRESRIGMVVLHPIPNYMTSQPVKLLEYMLAGLPVVVCDFPYYRTYVEDTLAGIMVDPLDQNAIAEALHWLLEHPDEAEAMGQRGREAVLTTFNWESEARKLVALYQKILAADVDQGRRSRQ